MTNVVKTALHFRFDDGTRCRFTSTLLPGYPRNPALYDFRMYSIVELREALVEAGFKETFVWVSSTRARDNEVGSGLEDKSFSNEDEVKEVEVSPEEYVLADRYLPQMESYNAYIVGLT
ncbi:MAG: hypothetical protein BJ554DRAFT_4615 [Olpidium bornovanus]|uniref:Uncharacterized protein n=1 Tax=Olpidium bornovanus TaxID=278681 RepID=A0A8H8DEZ0_9FUNG|nr:MAG: hypothetical protein BJ554DRAFT_4615 [Olpidium bornovanus]